MPRKYTKRYTSEFALRVSAEAGFTPREPYPESAVIGWELTCDTCDRLRRIPLSDLVTGRRATCMHGHTIYTTVLWERLSDLVSEYYEGASVRVLARGNDVSYGAMLRALREAHVVFRAGGRRRRVARV